MTPENVIRTYSDMVYRIAFARAGTKADADESKAELYRELQKLSSDARLLLHLYYFEELKTAEIAKLLHRKESTVRVQLTRAREKLKTQLEEEVVLGLLRV